MKKILAILAMLVVLASSAFASTTETTLEAPETMGFDDSEVGEFCIEDGSGNPLDVDVLVDPICKDLNGFLGCNSGDEFDPAGFSVTPQYLTTGEDGCVLLDLVTDLSEDDGGLFYYTVNGQVEGTTVGSETGSVLVPEFGIVAAGAALVGAGAYIARKRKN